MLYIKGMSRQNIEEYVQLGFEYIDIKLFNEEIGKDIWVYLFMLV